MGRETLLGDVGGAHAGPPPSDLFGTCERARRAGLRPGFPELRSTRPPRVSRGQTAACGCPSSAAGPGAALRHHRLPGQECGQVGLAWHGGRPGVRASAPGRSAGPFQGAGVTALGPRGGSGSLGTGCGPGLRESGQCPLLAVGPQECGGVSAAVHRGRWLCRTRRPCSVTHRPFLGALEVEGGAGAAVGPGPSSECLTACPLLSWWKLPHQVCPARRSPGSGRRGGGPPPSGPPRVPVSCPAFVPSGALVSPRTAGVRGPGLGQGQLCAAAPTP